MQAKLLPQLTLDRFDSVRLATELMAFVNQAGKEASLRRGRLRSLFQIVANHFRQELRSGSADPETALAVLDRCLEAETQLDRNANQATLLECWLDDLAGILSACSC